MLENCFESVNVNLSSNEFSFFAPLILKMQKHFSFILVPVYFYGRKLVKCVWIQSLVHFLNDRLIENTDVKRMVLVDRNESSIWCLTWLG